MSTSTALARAEFTLLVRNRVLLFNALVMPLLFPVAFLFIGRENGSLPDATVSSALEVFALFLLVFLVYYNLLSAYATRRDELVLKRLRTGEATDNEILLGPAIPSFALTTVLTIVVASSSRGEVSNFRPAGGRVEWKVWPRMVQSPARARH